MTSDSNEDRIMDRFNEIMADFDKHPYARLMERNVALEARIRELESERDEAVTQMIEAKVERGKAQERVRELEAENARINTAYKILTLGLCGDLDSHDAGDLATLCKKGDAIRWSEFSPAARKLVEPILAKLHAAQPDKPQQGE